MKVYFVKMSTVIILSWLILPAILSAELKRPVNLTISTPNISRDHITVFFDHRVRYHTHEADNAYTKDDLAVLVNVVSQRFNKLLIDTAPKLKILPPDHTAPSRVWIPSVVAAHNAQHNSTSPPLEVLVSFEFDIDIYQDDPLHFETSFDTAKYMADEANHIHPDTVKTLMMTMYLTEKIEYAEESYDYSYWQYIQDWHHEDQLELIYLQHLYHLAWPYHLGIFMHIHDCGPYKGPLDPKVKEILPYLETIAVFIDPSTFHHLTTLNPEDTLKMFVAKFEDCEAKLQEAKPGLKVVPSSLWQSHRTTIQEVVLEWQMMSTWAVESNREVVMYEAFDTPGGRDFYYWGHGWWRLKDRTAYQINETSFVEKFEDANSDVYTKTIYSFEENASSSEEDDTSAHKRPLPSPPVTNCTKNSTDSSPSPPSTSPSIQYPSSPPTIIQTTTTNHAVYIVLVLLSILCTVLVVTQVYFHSKLVHSPVSARGHGRFRSKGHDGHYFTNPGLPAIPSSSLTGSLVNQNFNRHHNSSTAIDVEDEEVNLDEGEVASIHGSVLEMTDTTPIVSVAYKKM